MQLTQTKEQTEQQFYDSRYLISHSKKTVTTYRSAINHFKKFVKTKYEFDETELVKKIKTGELDVYNILIQFIIYLDKINLSPRGMRSYLSGVKGYLRTFGVRINSDDYRQLVKIPRIVRTKEIAVTKEMILQILHVSSPKLKTAVTVSIASGVRLGELVQLKLSDVDFNTVPTKITIRGNASKGRATRETFLTSEATNALKNYLKKYFDWKEGEKNYHLQDTYIFWKISKSKKSSENTPAFDTENAKQSLQISLRHHIEKIPELNIKNENGLNAVHFHAFRKFFRTTVGNVCGRDFSEALLGHAFYMDTYYILSDDQKRQMYLDAEPHLTVSDFKSVEKNLQALSTKHQNLANKVEDLMECLKNNSISVPDFLMR